MRRHKVNVEVRKSKKDQLASKRQRKPLSRERNPPIDLMIGHGIVPICIRFLQNFVSPMIQFEPAWALANIASGTSEQTRCVIDNNTVQQFISLKSTQQFIKVHQLI